MADLDPQTQKPDLELGEVLARAPRRPVVHQQSSRKAIDETRKLAANLGTTAAQAQSLALAAETTGAGLWSLDLASGRIWATATLLEMLGLPADEALNMDRLLEVIPYDKTSPETVEKDRSNSNRNCRRAAGLRRSSRSRFSPAASSSRKPTIFTRLPSSRTSKSSAVRSGTERPSESVTNRGTETTVIAWAGDGGTFDIGLQALSGAAERNEDFIYFCYDNEAYMNTGVQRSSATPWGAWTTTTDRKSVV